MVGTGPKKSRARAAAKAAVVYPIALDLRGKPVVVVGAGAVAARKLAGLLEAGAHVTVVAPAISAGVREIARSSAVRIEERAFAGADLDGAMLVFAATSDPAVNAAVVAAARARRVLVNDTADGTLGDFASSLAHRTGGLTFAVATGGASPSFARRLQRELRERFDDRYGRAAKVLAFARDYVKSVVPAPDRGPVMADLAERDIDALAALDPSAMENEVDEAYAALGLPARASHNGESFGRLVCATRASALAMWQTRHVASVFAQAGLVSEILQISTKGDRVLDRSLAAIGSDGVFVKELETALRDGRADYAVHSCKDLPSSLPGDMRLCAIGPRADARDALCSERYPSLDALPAGALVGTSSPRRRAQLEALRPDLRFETIRGNVDTRLRKLRDGEYDAIVLAQAGLDRLGLRATHTVALDPRVMVPAVAQGALGIECRRADDALADRIHAIFAHPATELAVTAERAFLRTLQGGCQAPVGAHGIFEGDLLHLDAAMADESGTHMIRGDASARVADAAAAETLGVALAERLLAERDRDVSVPLAGRLFLLPRTQDRPSRIAPALRGAGAEVVEAADSDAAHALLGGRRPHALLFPSSGSVRAIEAYLAILRTSNDRPIVAAMGDASSAEASAAGFPPDIVAHEPSVGAFVQTVTRYVVSKTIRAESKGSE